MDTDLLKQGRFRDRRSDLPQFGLCTALEQHARFVAWDTFPGYIASSLFLEILVRWLHKYPQRSSVKIMGCGRMMSAAALGRLTEDEEAAILHMPVCRRFKGKELSHEAPPRTGWYRTIDDKLEPKAVRGCGWRYAVYSPLLWRRKRTMEKTRPHAAEEPR